MSPTQDEARRDQHDALADQLLAYFRSADSEERKEIGRRIEKVANGCFDAIALKLPTLTLWPRLAEREGRLVLSLNKSGKHECAFRLPEAYDPARSWPLIVWFGDRGASVEEAIRSLAEFIVVVPDRPLNGRFFEPDRESSDLRSFVRELRRLFHVDADRVYLFGHAAGGERAWLSAMLYPDLFAGVFVSDAYPRLPYPGAAYPIFLRNLSNVPVVSVWHPPTEQAVATEQILFRAQQERIAEWSGRINLPIRTVIVDPSASDGQAVRTPLIHSLLALRRKSTPTNIDHWFRYPEHGRAYWIECTQWSGEAFEAEEFSILPSAKIDRNEFIAETIKGWLGYLGATVEGQTIRVETKGCAAIRLSIPIGLVDLQKPVTVNCNGLTRWEGRIEPKTEALLQNAYESWDFSHPVAAEVTFSIRRDGTPP